jgi:hypothetical protein
MVSRLSSFLVSGSFGLRRNHVLIPVKSESGQAAFKAEYLGDQEANEPPAIARVLPTFLHDR